MIKIRISQSGKDIRKIDIHGHALSSDYGNDLVCAGVSSIVFGAMNAIDRIVPNVCSFQIKENNIQIYVDKPSDLIPVLLKMLIIELETMEESYPENIQIKRKEV